MPGLLFCFLANDHERLDGLLRRAMTEAGAVDCAASAEFRAGLLTHISLEEKILLPAARRCKPRHDFVYTSADVSRPCEIAVSP
jgi:hypothetical protein